MKQYNAQSQGLFTKKLAVSLVVIQSMTKMTKQGFLNTSSPSSTPISWFWKIVSACPTLAFSQDIL